MDTSLPATANAVFDYQRTLLSVELNHFREGDRTRTCNEPNNGHATCDLVLHQFRRSFKKMRPRARLFERRS